MLGIGGGEMVALAILALLVFGPEGLPEIMKTVARTIKAFKTAANDFQSEVNTALALETQKNEVQQRRRRRSLPAPEAAGTAQLPASVDDATTMNANESPAALLESNPGSTPLGEPQAMAAQPEFASLDPGEAASLAHQDETLNDLIVPSTVDTAVEEDDEFGPRLPMTRPDRSAEAVIVDEDLEADLREQEDEELSTTSSAEVGA